MSKIAVHAKLGAQCKAQKKNVILAKVTCSNKVVRQFIFSNEIYETS